MDNPNYFVLLLAGFDCKSILIAKKPVCKKMCDCNFFADFLHPKILSNWGCFQGRQKSLIAKKIITKNF
jgi:hypothetical protein